MYPIIHISDINYEIADSTVSCFADDTRILLGIKDDYTLSRDAVTVI